LEVIRNKAVNLSVRNSPEFIIKERKEGLIMKRRLIFVFLMLVCTLMITSCTSSPSATKTPGTPDGSQVAQNPTVSIENFSFNPAVLTVSAGTTVVWTNKDTAKHDIKSADFSSKALAKGETFEFKFDKKGTYNYSCGIHPAMTGQIIVE
jgi:plastocyanin